LLQTPDEELLRMRNFGKKSLDEIKERLAARGLIEMPERTGEEDELVDLNETEQPTELGDLGDESGEGNRPGDADERVATGRGTLEEQ
ncbi:MAG: hypothetical protein HYY42_04830, partial [Chloroflexi bacterium]|nr:hypothetical protein [Chloroflexota bacterium]